MSTPELVPRSPFIGVVYVWIISAVLSITVGVLTAVKVLPLFTLYNWFAIALATALVASFVIQLAYGRSRGFIERVAAGCGGAILIMGFVSFIFALILPGLV